MRTTPAADRPRVPEDGRQRREQRLVEAPELRVLAEAQEEGLPGAPVGPHENAGEQGGRGHVPRPEAPPPGDGEQAGEELRLEAEGRKEGRRERTPRVEGKEGESHEEQAEGLVVSAACDLHQGKRVPRPHEQSLRRQRPAAGGRARGRRGPRARTPRGRASWPPRNRGPTRPPPRPSARAGDRRPCTPCGSSPRTRGRGGRPTSARSDGRSRRRGCHREAGRGPPRRSD